LNSNEQIILVNFYNSLTSKGGLNWDIEYDLCGQTGVVCDSSNPQSVFQMYFVFLFFTFSFQKTKLI